MWYNSSVELVNQYLTQYYGLDWAAFLIGAIGMWRLGDKRRSGFIFYMIAAVAGIIFAILAKSAAYIVANTVIMVLNLRGYLKWGRSTDFKM